MVFLALFSCGYKVEKEPSQNLNLTDIPMEKMGYAELQTLVLQPKCATCHNWATSGNYDLVFSRIADIQAKVTAGEMPKANSATGPLTNSEREILLSWIARGAPELGSSNPNTPVPAPKPTLPNPPCECIRRDGQCATKIIDDRQAGDCLI
jgi:hypothetical protein